MIVLKFGFSDEEFVDSSEVGSYPENAGLIHPHRHYPVTTDSILIKRVMAIRDEIFLLFIEEIHTSSSCGDPQSSGLILAYEIDLITTQAVGIWRFMLVADE